MIITNNEIESTFKPYWIEPTNYKNKRTVFDIKRFNQKEKQNEQTKKVTTSHTHLKGRKTEWK